MIVLHYQIYTNYKFIKVPFSSLILYLELVQVLLGYLSFISISGISINQWIDQFPDEDMENRKIQLYLFQQSTNFRSISFLASVAVPVKQERRQT